MSRAIMLIPIGSGVGVTSVSLGMVRAMERQGVAVNFFKPIAQPRAGDTGPERSTTTLRNGSSINPPEPFPIKYAENLISSGSTSELLENIVERFRQGTKESDVIIVEGLVPTDKHQFANDINYSIAKALNAKMVFVTQPSNDTSQQLKERIEIAVSSFGGKENNRIAGCIINKVGAPVDEHDDTRPDLTEMFDIPSGPSSSNLEVLQMFSKSPLPILGCIPWSAELIAPRVKDLAIHLGAQILNKGDLDNRRLQRVTFCARSIPNMIEHFKAGSMLVTSGDRSDVIIAASLAVMNGMKIGCLLLTGDYPPEDEVMKLCKRAMEAGLPILLIKSNTWQTAQRLQNFNMEIPVDDIERIDKVQEYIASHIDNHWLNTLTEDSSLSRRLSPPAFRYHLTELARKTSQRIVLPEGEEPRTIQAALICAQRGIAKPVLLGDPEEILRVATQQGIVLTDEVEIINPIDVIERYVAPMVELRKSKGLTAVVAREQLQDTVVLGTMMLAESEVTGLVSGAIHTTANTIRPALQLIKTAPGANLVSSIFFMLLPDQVLVYGDCAINPDPTAEQLADIAIQSADSAIAFGIDPKVAMISYSTGDSGAGSDVEKVREATKIAQQRRPDLLIDGPLQYDAAVMENVAKSKAPNSPVAGKATVFIFPDLNTGNTTYKAVQRSADLISIGPMLQGMRKPVNDLSRGALVDDIVYTIALTAIQATQASDKATAEKALLIES
ncbi:phosphate acetyltransferase [Psychromonas antarctica]|jgi:phosphate acetyltransferase|uniref:phosphate acetyltransferase n=1 Tax=Psychromonas antarctica TaxID=67573 RepID=UPI001EE7AA31|nr:phosphate acetyltransferase [Psychromonas antarctica]MCG6202677.1 phosphate acetyltransferase [Psychromonas antarctica]